MTYFINIEWYVNFSKEIMLRDKLSRRNWSRKYEHLSAEFFKKVPQTSWKKTRSAVSPMRTTRILMFPVSLTVGAGRRMQKGGISGGHFPTQTTGRCD